MIYTCKILLIDEDMDRIRSLQRIMSGLDIRCVIEVSYFKNDFVSTLLSFLPHIIIAGLPEGGKAIGNLVSQHKPEGSTLLVVGKEKVKAEACYQQAMDYWVPKEGLPAAVLCVHEKTQCSLEVVELERQLEETSTRLRTLNKKHETEKEAERLRISRELHDELGQVLTALKIDIKMLERHVAERAKYTDAQISGEFSDVYNAINRSMRTVRSIATGLRPDMLDKLGLIEAIKWRVEEISRKHALKFEVSLPDKSITTDEHFSINIYRIVQEVLTNVVRHAEASKVTLDIHFDSKYFNIEISDNGKGFNEKTIPGSSLGLAGLKERVSSLKGQYRIASEPGKGTAVSVRVPFETQIKIKKV